MGSLATATSAVIAVSVSRTMDKRAELKQAHREQMAPMYRELIERVRTVEQDPEAASTFWKDFSVRMTLYGPPEVIKAQLALSRQIEANAGLLEPSIPTMLRLEQLYRAIRADLGHNDRSLGQGDLLRLYITDLDDLMGPFESPPLSRSDQNLIAARQPSAGSVS